MIRDAIAHMHCHYQEVQNLQEYADRCGMTPDRFCHVFKEHTGVSPYAYLISLRMRLARELLSGSDMPVKDVAMLVAMKMRCISAVYLQSAIISLQPSFVKRPKTSASHKMLWMNFK